MLYLGQYSDYKTSYPGEMTAETRCPGRRYVECMNSLSRPLNSPQTNKQTKPKHPRNLTAKQKHFQRCFSPISSCAFPECSSLHPPTPPIHVYATSGLSPVKSACRAVPDPIHTIQGATEHSLPLGIAKKLQPYPWTWLWIASTQIWIYNSNNQTLFWRICLGTVEKAVSSWSAITVQ